MTEIRGDIGRAMDQYGTVLARLAAVEGRAMVRGRMDFTKLEDRVAEALRNLQGAAGGRMMDGVNEAAREIRAEGDAWNNALGGVGRQVAEVNQRAIDGVAKLHGMIYSVTGDMKEATSELARSIGAALDKAQEDLNTPNVELSRRLDELVGDAGSSFRSLESEIVATLEAIRRNFAETRRVIERTAETEKARIRRNTDDAVARYEQFGMMMLDEIRQNNAESDDAESAILNPVRAEIRELTKSTPMIDEAEAKIEKLEKQFQAANTQVRESIVTLTGNYDDLARKFGEFQKSVDTGFDDIEKQLNAYIEDSRPGGPQDHMNKLSSEIQKRTESRLQVINAKMPSLLAHWDEFRRANIVPDPSFSICQKINQVVDDIEE